MSSYPGYEDAYDAYICTMYIYDNGTYMRALMIMVIIISHDNRYY